MVSGLGVVVAGDELRGVKRLATLPLPRILGIKSLLSIGYGEVAALHSSFCWGSPQNLLGKGVTGIFSSFEALKTTISLLEARCRCSPRPEKHYETIVRRAMVIICKLTAVFWSGVGIDVGKCFGNFA